MATRYMCGKGYVRKNLHTYVHMYFHRAWKGLCTYVSTYIRNVQQMNEGVAKGSVCSGNNACVVKG